MVILATGVITGLLGSMTAAILMWQETKKAMGTRTPAVTRPATPEEGSGRPFLPDRAVERAYLAVDQFDVHGLFDGTPARIHFKIFNRGRTPAQQIETIHKVGVYVEIPTTPDYEDPLPGPSVELASGADLNVVTDVIQLTPAMAENVRSGKSSLHFWGRISYRDIFQDPHHLGFGFTFDPDIKKFRFTKVPGYNYTD
jgi:hypothetical protein